VEKNRDKKSESEIFHEIVCEKFEYITPKILLDTFSNTELKVLSDTNVNHEAIQAIFDIRDRLTALRCYLTPKKAIFDIVLELMSKNNSAYINLKSIDDKLSQDFVNSSKRTKNPHSQFLKDLFTNDFFNNSPYEFKNIVKIDKTTIRNVVRVKNEYSDEFKTLKNKKQRELHLKALLQNVEIEIVDADGVTQIPTITPTLTPTNAYINELQGGLVC
jgi:hypothetical protein